MAARQRNRAGWGKSLQLHVMDYTRATEAPVVERPLIPNPANPGEVSSVIMGVGRRRKRVSIRAWALPDEFGALEQDHFNRTARTVQFGDGLNFIALIESLSAERRLGTSRIFYEATFIEVQ